MEKQTGQGLRRSQKDYTLAFKLSVVEAVERGEMTYKKAQEHYGIQGTSTVLVWLRQHGNLNWRHTNPIPMTPTEPTPDQRIKALEKQLEDARLRAELLDTLIDLAETQYGVSIRKNFCPKPPKK